MTLRTYISRQRCTFSSYPDSIYRDVHALIPIARLANEGKVANFNLVYKKSTFCTYVHMYVCLFLCLDCIQNLFFSHLVISCPAGELIFSVIISCPAAELIYSVIISCPAGELVFFVIISRPAVHIHIFPHAMYSTVN